LIVNPHHRQIKDGTADCGRWKLTQALLSVNKTSLLRALGYFGCLGLMTTVNKQATTKTTKETTHNNI
jgi:hypothetical protein